jgi:hypothetical protein
MREHVLLFCLLGLVLTATIILVTAPGARDLGTVPRRMNFPPPAPAPGGSGEKSQFRAQDDSLDEVPYLTPNSEPWPPFPLGGGQSGEGPER